MLASNRIKPQNKGTALLLQQKMPLLTEAKAMFRLPPFNRDFGEGKKADFSAEERLAKAAEFVSFAKSLHEPDRSRMLSWLHLDGWLWELKCDADDGNLPGEIGTQALKLDAEVAALVENAPYRLR